MVVFGIKSSDGRAAELSLSIHWCFTRTLPMLVMLACCKICPASTMGSPMAEVVSWMLESPESGSS